MALRNFPATQPPRGVPRNGPGLDGGSADLPSSGRAMDAPFSYSQDSEDSGRGYLSRPDAAAPLGRAVPAAAAASAGSAKEGPRGRAVAGGVDGNGGGLPSASEGPLPPTLFHFGRSAGGDGGHGPGPSDQSSHRGAGLDREEGSRHSGYSARADDGDGEDAGVTAGRRRQGFKVYWQRWLMLMYMSVLNLLVRTCSVVTSCQTHGWLNLSSVSP